MGAGYTEKLIDLLDRQPTELTDLQKLLKIDYLSCIEMKGYMDFKHEVNDRWFWDLSIVLTECYRLLLGETLLDTLNYSEIVACHLWKLDNRFVDLKDYFEFNLAYIALRRNLIEELQEKELS